MTTFCKVSVNFPAEIGSPDFHFDINGMEVPGLLDCHIEKRGTSIAQVSITFLAEVTSMNKEAKP